MGTVLVTGAFGLVGSETVAQLHQQGRHVVATDLDIPANRKASRGLPAGVEVRWADLTDAHQVSALVADVAPEAIIHLAAVIPTACYRNVGLAQRVNVAGTASLVAAAERLAVKPRFVQASSVAVHGPRNPRRDEELGPDSPLRPIDCYGAQKLEAERTVRDSDLEWVVLRLGAVVSTRLRDLPISADVLFLEWSSPIDGRITTVDVRDAANAFVAATTADVVGETLMIGGDASHRRLQGYLGPALTEAIGLSDCYPPGRPGDPDDDDTWFVCDWMDTARAQEALGFQNHSLPDMLVEVRARVGRWRVLFAAASPIARAMLKRRQPYRGHPGTYADPWGLVFQRWPEAAAEGRSRRPT
ncbi:MAG TPA: NAD(P)-dependent oxidoreductase [Mycobacterium sp.]|nr:NAD(P)-dependent oxidoreductase [Mycobacterium sp.]